MTAHDIHVAHPPTHTAAPAVTATRTAARTAATTPTARSTTGSATATTDGRRRASQRAGRRRRGLLRRIGPLGPTPSELALQHLDLPPTLRR